MEQFYRAIRNAKNTYQRRMIITDDLNKAIEFGKKLNSGILVGWEKIEGLEHFKFKEMSKTDELLGKTFDNLILDLRGSFTANDLGRVISTVKGGGIIIIITPKFEEWINAKLSYHEKLIIPPYDEKDLFHNFIPRLIKKFYMHEGIWIYRNNRWEKESIEEEIKVIEREKIKIPKDVKGDIRIYKLAATNDQIKVLKEIEKIEENKPILVIADRGRGKSAVIGLGIALLRSIFDKKLEVVITAPKRKNLDVLIEFLEKGLKALNIPYSWKNKNLLIGKKIKVSIDEIEVALKKNADLFIVDEAAAIPLPILKKFADKKRTIFSTTVHGYEGSGRTFSIRFKKYLEEKKQYVEIKMKTPIRYNDEDPIEKWLFDTLLLDAEPDEIDEIKEIETIIPDKNELFKDEETLRKYFALLIIAHYKNTPNDLMTLADAPHHFAAITKTNGKIINSIQFAYEGNLKENQILELYNNPKPEGNLLPDIFAKHYRMFEVGKRKGARIVRIVTNPLIWSKGIGSKALENLEKSIDVEYIGSSFGAAPKLVNFWAKNGYIPINISPARNPISGEYSLVVVKGLNDELRNLIKKAGIEFSKRFMEALNEIYKNMEVEVAWEILKAMEKQNYPLNLTKLEKIRFQHFIEGRHVYEINIDVITKITKWYFATKQEFLSKEEEFVLIAKVLQRRDWKEIKEEINVENVFDVLRDAMKKIYEKI